MSRRIRAGLLAAFVMVITGCGATPTERWVTASGAFDFSVRATLVAHDAGKISDDDLRDLDPVVESANFALDAAYERLPDGGDVFDQAMDAIDAAIVGLETAGGER